MKFIGCYCYELVSTLARYQCRCPEVHLCVCVRPLTPPLHVSFHIIVSVCVSILVYVHLCSCVCMQHVYMYVCMEYAWL